MNELEKTRKHSFKKGNGGLTCQPTHWFVHAYSKRHNYYKLVQQLGGGPKKQRCTKNKQVCTQTNIQMAEYTPINPSTWKTETVWSSGWATYSLNYNIPSKKAVDKSEEKF